MDKTGGIVMKLSKEDIYTCAVLDGFLRMGDDNFNKKGVSTMTTKPESFIAEQMRKAELAIKVSLDNAEIGKLTILESWLISWSLRLRCVNTVIC